MLSMNDRGVRSARAGSLRIRRRFIETDPALVEAAKREMGVTSTTDLGLLALATLAQPDPVVAFMRRTRGRLGGEHKLDA